MYQLGALDEGRHDSVGECGTPSRVWTVGSDNFLFAADIAQ